MNASLLGEWRTNRTEARRAPSANSYQAHLAEKLLKERQFQAVE